MTQCKRCQKDNAPVSWEYEFDPKKVRAKICKACFEETRPLRIARYKELGKSYLQRETVWKEIHRMFREYQDLNEKLANARANLERLQQTTIPTVRQVIQDELESRFPKVPKS